MTSESAYRPLRPARRPGGRPPRTPQWRVLVHRQYKHYFDQLVARVGLQSAQRLWDYLATSPDQGPAVGATTILRGRAGKPKGPGWSRTIHYELSSMARVNFQYNSEYKTDPDGDEHAVVAILTIDYSSH